MSDASPEVEVASVGVSSQPQHGIRRLAQRLSWNLLDQMISSISNAALSIVVARTVNAASFGAFSIAFTVFQLAILGSRALLGQPLAIRFSGATPPVRREAARGNAGGALSFGVLVGLGCVGAGLLSGPELRPVLLVMAVGLPGLLLQDAWRNLFFTELRPARATANDLVWTLLQVPLVVVVIVAGRDGAAYFVAAWSAAGAAAAAFGVWQSGVRPSFRTARNFVREQWDISRFLLGELVVGQGAYQGALLAIGVLGALSEVGSLRGATVILAPVSVLSLSVNAFAVPELSRRQLSGPAAYRRVAAGISALLMIASVAWATIFLVLPDSAGQALLGDSWTGTRSVLLQILLFQLGLCAAAGATVVTYALGRTRETFRVSLVAAFLLITGAVVGVEIADAPGAALAMGLATVLSAPFAWRQLWKVTADVPVTGPDNGTSGVDANHRA